MSAALYKQMLKVKGRGFLNYALGSAFYMLMMFWLYPGIARNAESIDSLVASMPEGVGNALGLVNFSGSAEAFISGEYYGLILVLLLAIVCVQLSTQLMARLVDRGAMVYLLSTPTTRTAVAATQAAVLVTGLFIIAAATTLAGIAGNAWLLRGEYPFDTGKFIQLNVSAFFLFFAVAGICFLISSVFDDEKKASGVSGTIVFLFFSLDLIGKIGDRTEWLRDLSLFALYRPEDIIGGTAELAVRLPALAGVGLIAFGLAVPLFRRRDLPL
jgi:ABC-2 type transport system permease protein